MEEIFAFEIKGEYKIIGTYTGSQNNLVVGTKYGNCFASPSNLLSGKVPSIESAIDKNVYYKNQSIEKHGIRYSYSKVKYRSAKSKVIIICPHHGQFLQIAGDHLSGKGCPACANEIKNGVWKYSEWERQAMYQNILNHLKLI